jgi:hypothetical protein
VYSDAPEHSYENRKYQNDRKIRIFPTSGFVPRRVQTKQASHKWLACNVLE